jgi:pre-mRNA-splicing factor 38B
MSRAALWKQQDKVKEREDRAQFLYEEALEEGRNRARRNKSAIAPLWGADDGTFHLHPVLLQNAISSSYFQRCCETLPDWNAIVDEIYEQDLRHVQPTSGVGAASAPSTAFCLLLRLLLYRMTVPQLQSTLRHPDSVYIRAIGFLYLRYSCPPEDVLGHIEPHLLDPTAIDVEMGGGHKSIGGGRGGGRPPAAASAGSMTLGEYVRKLFGGGFSGGGGSGASRDYYGTPLPRYPTNIEREIRAKVLHYDRIHERATRHLHHPTRLSRDFVVGQSVRALYGDEDNPVQWYDAVIDRVITQDPITGHALVHPQFVVTFPEYGNTETVSLGELDIPGGSESAAPNAGTVGGRGGGGGGVMRHGRGYDGDDRHHHQRHGPRRTDDDRLYDEVVRQERDSAAASSRSGWAARRPPTTKAALTTNAGRYAVPDGPRGRGDVDERPQHHRHHSSDQDRPPRGRPPSNDRDRESRLPAASSLSPPSVEPPRKRSAGELSVIEEKKRRLLSKYG